ncbi:hypothetical protein GOARA_060_00050 [Gordonia araii NBRC 100433]|uniref:Uncharacterized protein n=1 Tax=Gordonia araii NBRC 100433 TaxID=1073574 RepID=G7H3X9_9ACTN|nr:hypothetical protein [Gordonia araii]NNG98923.1 hypothetical protein [Gordonia araii NBRC 100433]GAB10554.1 hypothetical protein GOARA_060_00050 [Gordonia araii NBRC 100433]
MKPMYRRSTRTATLADLPERVRAELVAHAEANQLTVDDSARLWLTHSVNLPAKSVFGRKLGRRRNSADPDAEHDVLLALLPKNLVIVTAGEKRGVGALSVPLSQAGVAPGPVLGPIEDEGFTVSGFPGDNSAPGTFFVGLGPDDAGCFEAVRDAIVEAKA